MILAVWVVQVLIFSKKKKKKKEKEHIMSERIDVRGKGWLKHGFCTKNVKVFVLWFSKDNTDTNREQLVHTERPVLTKMKLFETSFFLFSNTHTPTHTDTHTHRHTLLTVLQKDKVRAGTHIKKISSVCIFRHGKKNFKTIVVFLVTGHTVNFSPVLIW